MEFRILGPVEALDGEGSPLELPRGRATCASRSPPDSSCWEAVSVDRVIEDLWSDRLPAEPEQRRSGRRLPASEGKLGSDVVLSEAGGYRLLLEPGESRFGAVRGALAGKRSGRSPRGAATLPLPPRLLRQRPRPSGAGPRLRTSVSSASSRRRLARLEELRRPAGEPIDADLTLGRHGEVVGEFEASSGASASERLRGSSCCVCTARVARRRPSRPTARPAHARRRARDRAVAGATGARAVDPPTGSGTLSPTAPPAAGPGPSAPAPGHVPGLGFRRLGRVRPAARPSILRPLLIRATKR